MADGSTRHKRVTQMGNHIHNHSPNYRRAVEIVKSGKLGRITRVHCWKTSPTEPYHDEGACHAAGRARLRLLARAGAEAARTSRCGATSTSAISGTTPAAPSSTSGATSSTSPCGRSTWRRRASVSATGGRFFVQRRYRDAGHARGGARLPELLFLFSFRPTPLPGFEHMGPHRLPLRGNRGVARRQLRQARGVGAAARRSRTFHVPIRRFPIHRATCASSSTPSRRAISRRRATSATGISVTMPGLLANIAFRTGRRASLGRGERAVRGRQGREPLSLAPVSERLETGMNPSQHRSDRSDGKEQPGKI